MCYAEASLESLQQYKPEALRQCGTIMSPKTRSSRALFLQRADLMAETVRALCVKLRVMGTREPLINRLQSIKDARFLRHELGQLYW